MRSALVAATDQLVDRLNDCIRSVELDEMARVLQDSDLALLAQSGEVLLQFEPDLLRVPAVADPMAPYTDPALGYVEPWVTYCEAFA